GLFYHLGRVAGEMSLKDLKYAMRIFQGLIRLKDRGILGLATAIFSVSARRFRMPWKPILPGSTAIHPCFGTIFVALGIPTGEKSIEVFGITKIVAQQGGGVGVVQNVVVEETVVLQSIADQTAEENDVAASA